MKVAARPVMQLPKPKVAARSSYSVAGRTQSLDVDEATYALLEELANAEKLPFKRLLRLVHANQTACEEALERGQKPRTELRELFGVARTELKKDWHESGGASSSSSGGYRAASSPTSADAGLFSDLMVTLGLTQPARAPVLIPTAQEADLDKAHFIIYSREPVRRSLQDAAQLIHDIEDHERRIQKLRALWPCIEDAVNKAVELGAPLEIATIQWTLKEAMNWRKRAASIDEFADVLAGRLLDAVEVSRLDRKEKLRLRAEKRVLLRGMSKVAAARAAATLWLQGRERGRPDAVAEAADTLERNLKVADNLDERLKKCAGMVMRAEPHRTTVRRAVRRLQTFKTDLTAAVDKVAFASGQGGCIHGDLSEFLGMAPAPSRTTDEDKEDVGSRQLEIALRHNGEALENALRDLLDAIDASARLLHACPAMMPGAKVAAEGEEEEPFQKWMKDELLASVSDEDRASSEGSEDSA
eukprot:TRINITY_DN81418_c0_g1_i1.p1 TRINITY_DN81418_c0_g1~~TRINITY_DN81418_c0_g1_i1.p1  ORF type:complete len:472 (-),score=95.91 TRINITY_DN81418_c0_g1_i1:120-1535(-)